MTDAATFAFPPRGHMRRRSLLKDSLDENTWRSLLSTNTKLRPRAVQSVRRTRILIVVGAVLVLTACYVVFMWIFGRGDMHLNDRRLQDLHPSNLSGYDSFHGLKDAQKQQHHHHRHHHRHHRHHSARDAAPEFRFQSSAQELGALVGFLSAFASNALPLDMDPLRSLDPDLVLEFDARSPTGPEQTQEHVAEVWAHNPVVIFSELVHGNPRESRDVKQLFHSFHLKPLPTTIDVDQRPDAHVLRPLLHRLTGTTQLPLVILAGEPIEVKTLFMYDEAETLGPLLESAGAVVNGSLPMKKRKH
jgi:hypothetical protein